MFSAQRWMAWSTHKAPRWLQAKLIVRPLLISVLLGLISNWPRVALAVENPLETKLREAIAEMECPGALVGVMVGSEPAQVYALGNADQESRSPMQRDCFMRIASVTKPFVGTAVLMLADEHILSIDDKIAKYVSGVPEGDKITLRQLANNTSGLFNSIENKDFQAAILASPKRTWSAEEILRFAFAKPAYHPPGTQWRYSNTNAVLLGEVIDKVSGMPHAKFIEQRICAPLKLQHTGFVQDALLPDPSPHGYRNGYETKWLGYGKTFYDVTGYSASWTGAAGNMYSTVDDLLKATKPLVTGALLGNESKRELMTWGPTGQPELDYGFCLGRYQNWQGHLGDVPGFSSFAGYLPARDTTIVVLANLSNCKDGTVPAARLRDIVINHLGLVSTLSNKNFYLNDSEAER